MGPIGKTARSKDADIRWWSDPSDRSVWIIIEALTGATLEMMRSIILCNIWFPRNLVMVGNPGVQSYASNIRGMTTSAVWHPSVESSS